MKRYLKPKKKARRPIYQKNEKKKGKDLEALCVMIRNVMFKIVKRLVKTNQDIIGEHCIRNGVMRSSGIHSLLGI